LKSRKTVPGDGLYRQRAACFMNRIDGSKPEKQKRGKASPTSRKAITPTKFEGPVLERTGEPTRHYQKKKVDKRDKLGPGSRADWP